MKLSRIVSTVAAIGLTGLAFAGEEIRTKIEIVTDDDSGDGMHVVLDSDELGFNLHDLQEGESRSIVDASGRTILVTRGADGITLDVDGKTIEMPMFDGKRHKMHKRMAMGAEGMGGVMIMTAQPVDEATQQAIKSLLESAGHGSEVRFVDHEGPHHGPVHVKIIKERIETTQ